MIYIDYCETLNQKLWIVDIAIKMSGQDSCRQLLPNKRVMTSKEYYETLNQNYGSS